MNANENDTQSKMIAAMSEQDFCEMIATRGMSNPFHAGKVAILDFRNIPLQACSAWFDTTQDSILSTLPINFFHWLENIPNLKELELQDVKFYSVYAILGDKNKDTTKIYSIRAEYDSSNDEQRVKMLIVVETRYRSFIISPTRVRMMSKDQSVDLKDWELEYISTNRAQWKQTYEYGRPMSSIDVTGHGRSAFRHVVNLITGLKDRVRQHNYPVDSTLLIYKRENSYYTTDEQYRLVKRIDKLMTVVCLMLNGNKFNYDQYKKELLDIYRKIEEIGWAKVCLEKRIK